MNEPPSEGDRKQDSAPPEGIPAAGSPGDDEKERERGWLAIFTKQAGPYMDAAYTLTGALLGLGLLGYFLDAKLNTSPACLLGGLLLGLAVGFYGLAKVIFKK